MLSQPRTAPGSAPGGRAASADDSVRTWNAQHPDDSKGPITPDDWRAGSSGLQVPVETFVEDADPGDEPFYSDSSTVTPVMVCTGPRGREYGWSYKDGYGHEEKVDDREYLFLTCGLVDEPSPVGVTISVHFGGIGVRAKQRPH